MSYVANKRCGLLEHISALLNLLFIIGRMHCFQEGDKNWSRGEERYLTLLDTGGSTNCPDSIHIAITVFFSRKRVFLSFDFNYFGIY